MRAAFFKKGSGDDLTFIAFAKSNNPEKEFRQLIAGNTGTDFLFKVYGRDAPPSLNEDCVLGMGRTKEEAKEHIVLTANDV